jgi:hypothetical protein
MDNFLGSKIKNDITNSNGVTLIPAQTTLNNNHVDY